MLGLTLPAAAGWAASRLGGRAAWRRSNNFRAVLPLPVQKAFGGAVLAYMSLPCVCVCVCVCVCACRHVSADKRV